jgi:uncharacterized membrane protein (UPF0127 family)
MTSSRRRLAVFVLILLVACGRDAESPPSPDKSVITAPVDTCGEDPPPSRPEFGKGTALIEHGDESVIVNVEVAETDEQRQFGLMFEKELESDAGMVFIFFEENTGGFYMKNTFLPLSIAYFDVDGKIVKIVDMDPCEIDSTLYDPGAPYQGALEVNQGMFEEWGITKGDVISVIPASPGL